MSNQNKALVGGVGLVRGCRSSLCPVAPSPARRPTNHPSSPCSKWAERTKSKAACAGWADGAEQYSTGAGRPEQAQTRANQPVRHELGRESRDATPPQQTKLSPVTPGASVAVRLDSDFNSDNSTVGELLPATVVAPLTSKGNVIVQRGSSAQLKVVKIDKSGKTQVSRTWSSPW